MSPAPSPLAALDGGPHDVEFFFDPGCPFAWQTSVWIRRVAELRGVRVGWRFVSLKILNEDKDVPPEYREGHARNQRVHRVAAAVRDHHGNDAVGRFYEAYGRAYWYHTSDLPFAERLTDAADRVDLAELLTGLDLPASLAEAADDESHDAVLRAETEEAVRRAGADVGTPIITYDPPNGNSLFGPVISSVPDDERALAFYDALRTMVDFEGFSELKRSIRPDLALPLLAG